LRPAAGQCRRGEAAQIKLQAELQKLMLGSRRGALR
jgi:hypothetical protein